MDNQRLILLLALSLVVLLLWEAWQQDFAPQPQPVASAPAVAPGTTELADVPAQALQPPTVPTPPDASAPTTAPTDLGLATLKSGTRIRVKTDVLDLELDTIGGDLRQAKLRAYPVSADKPEIPFVILNDKQPPLFVAQTGLLSSRDAPDHHATFVAEQDLYELAPGKDTLQIPLQWTSPEGVTVTKRYTFKRGQYDFKVDYLIENNSAEPWQGRQYRQLQRSSQEVGGSAFIYTYTGGVIYSEEEKYEKISFDDMKDEDLGRSITGGWTAMIQHYFVSAWLPDQQETNYFYSKAAGDERYILGMVSPDITVAPGANKTLSTQFYVGPKTQHVLENLAPGLELTVDYGFLTVIAKPLFWLLRKIHEFVGNWGWSIAIVTLIIKLVFYKLSEASYKSMANMRRLQPKVVTIRERYGDDRQRMSQAMMELYKKEKINPFGGCLPMLVQIPVFIALYWVLLESVELRQAPFMLWITDLSSKDPYYVLPLLMGATMFIQQKLHPPPPDPVQAKVMMALPFVFTLFFAFFPAGLVLYWVVNNTLSITQQWYITRRVEKALEAAKS